MLSWIIVAALGGVIVGLILGVILAQALVRGHYTHIMSNQQAPFPSQRYRNPEYPYPEERY
jgi:hypothetical protein